ncbi:MAG: hypothetical protein BGP12_22895 [Rhodospirillales bacterium 70-18]|nr:hypothetical protein [Rhodospirillales bacterium]OJY70564.1 MAG: hypothetical protein BGP12_22895 [Rhodospirillales bacterium 70-18]
MRLTPILCAAALALSGCTLIDQRTFERTPQAPAADAAARARARAAAPPLLTIPFDQPGLDWGPALSEAVDAAQGRNPAVQFDVTTPVPTAAPPEVRDRFIRQGAADATAVANGLASLGVPPDRVHIGVRGDAGSPAREVRVYAR